jgi:hypothetical protein
MISVEVGMAIQGFAEDLKQRYEACRLRGRVNYCAAMFF